MRRHSFKALAGDSLPVMVPRNDKAAVPVSRERVRRLRKHLMVTLRRLRLMKDSQRSVSPLRPEPKGFAARVARTRLFSVQGMVLHERRRTCLFWIKRRSPVYAAQGCRWIDNARLYHCRNGVRVSRQPLFGGTRIIAQLRAASRNAACRAVSSTPRNRDLSCLVSGAGPRVFSPNSLRCRAISRPARAFPMFASAHCLPIGETTCAPLLKHRDASGMSEVTHTSVVPICSAIQLSAASAPSPTRTTLTFVMRGDRIGREPLLTTKTLT